jgi:nitric oxide reductase NorD protein
MTSRRFDVLREVDRETHAALRAVLGELDDECDLDALIDLLALVAAEAPDAARALAARAGVLSAALTDPTAMRKWALHGLQRHRNDAAARHRFFETHDPLVFADHLADDDSRHLLARREGLQHLLVGYGVAAKRVELHEPQALGLPPQSIAIGDELICFARRCVAVPAPARDLLYRAAIAHAAAHCRYSPLARPAGSRKPMLLAMFGLVEDARVERLMVQQYPGLHALWGRFHSATRESAGFDLAGLAARLARALHDPGYADDNTWIEKGRRLFEEAAAKDLHDIAAFDAVGRELAIGIEKMRLALPQHYRVQPAYRDDHALLWNMNAALPEDELRTTAREDFEQRPQDELPPDLKRVEVDPRRRTRHPEWDHRLQTLREDWATVIEAATPAHAAAPGARFSRARQRLRGLDRTPDRAIRLTRQAEGDELDLNTAIDSAIHQRARLSPDGRIFRRHGRRRRATAIVLLMDLSVSTERFVPGSFTTVLDVEKRAATLVAQSLDMDKDRVAVHGFASSGRHEVHYQSVKAFDEPFGAVQQARLAALAGGLSTRMGAALRHASAALAQLPVDHKVILMLTDGEPSDIDVVEDDYLVEDARHAVASAAQHGIRTFCLTLDRHADAYVRRIFGARNYLIADHADAFAGHTGQTLVRLVAH